jgi:protein-L-isoaspartate(D-aspartate) O-methyltransferase
MNVELARFNMIEQQIRPWEVLDPAVLSLLSTMQREDFVSPSQHDLAFADTMLPLIEGEPHGPSMLEPKVEARLLQELRVLRHERVLEVGAGSGFMAALLAHRAAEVTTLEIRPELAALAARNLRKAGLSRVKVLQLDGSTGLPGEAPFDVILLSGSVSAVPKTLLQQLRVGGRLAAIVGELPVMRARLFTRASETSWADVDLFDTVAPRLQGFGEPSRFAF